VAVAPYRLCVVVATHPKDASYAATAQAAAALADRAAAELPLLTCVTSSPLPPNPRVRRLPED
jgi:hypothetical protein